MCPGRPPAQSPDKPPPVLPLVLLDAGSCSDTYSSRQPPPPQPRNLLGRGHAKSLLKRGKGITPRFRLQRGVRSEAAAGRPASGPLHPATVHPPTPRCTEALLEETATDCPFLDTQDCSVTVTVEDSSPVPSRAFPGEPLLALSSWAASGWTVQVCRPRMASAEGTLEVGWLLAPEQVQPEDHPRHWPPRD